MHCKQKMIASFNRRVQTYDHFACLQKEVNQMLMSRISDFSPLSILEIGCGTGDLSKHMALHFSNANFLLTDISDLMVEKVRKMFSQHNHIAVQCMDGESLQLSIPYDLIISSMSLHWFNDIRCSLKKIITYLSSQGFFIFSGMGDQSFPEWRSLCELHALPLGMPSFLSESLLKEILPTIHIHRESKKVVYKNLYAFLNTLKKIGASTPHSNYVPLSYVQMKTLLTQYDKPFEVTYDIIYGMYQR